MPPPALDRALHDLDVLILPIDDSEHILTRQEADAIIRRYRPKSVILAHYLVKGAESVLSTLKSADRWVASRADVRRVTSGEMVFDAEELKGANGRVYYFGDGYKAK